MIRTFTFIVVILISVVSFEVNANPCTLCSEGTPNEFPDIVAAGGKTCSELAIDAAFYDENDRFCGFFRQVAREPCECDKRLSPTGSPTISKTQTPTAQRCTLCPNNKPIPDDFKDEKVTKFSVQTCTDVERTSMKYLESSNACANMFRPVGEKHCGCAIPDPTLIPSSSDTGVDETSVAGLESVDESINHTSGSITSLSSILIGCGVGLTILLLIGAFFVRRRTKRKEVDEYNVDSLPFRIQEANSNDKVDDDDLSCKSPLDEGIEIEIIAK